MLTTWKRLYEADWEKAFNTFMVILAQQYRMELMVVIGNQKQPSPVIAFWREGVQGLSPMQMTEGLRGYQRSEHGSFQPTPEDIKHYADGIEATDVPRKKTNPDCEACGGNGLRAADGRLYRDWDGRDKFKMITCDCSIVVYRDVVYKSAKFQLQAAPEDRKQPEPSREIPIPDIPAAKAMPSAYAPSAAELQEKKRQAFELAEKFKSK